MKEYGMMFKRCLAMFLAVVLLLSSSNISALLPIRAVESAKEPQGETVTLGVLIKDNFGGLSEEEIAVITSGYLKADKTYSYLMPTEKDDLISVDEKSGTVTAKVYTDPVYKTVWIPVSFDLTNGSAAITGYKDLPLAASGDVYTGTYDLAATISRVTPLTGQVLINFPHTGAVNAANAVIRPPSEGITVLNQRTLHIAA